MQSATSGPCKQGGVKHNITIQGCVSTCRGIPVNGSGFAWDSTASSTAISLYHTVGVYGDCYDLSPLKTIYKDFVHFHFQFEVDFTFNNIKVKNM